MIPFRVGGGGRELLEAGKYKTSMVPDATKNDFLVDIVGIGVGVVMVLVVYRR